ETELHPRPLQRPHPPIWAAGTSEAGLHWAGVHGWNVMTVGHPHVPEKQRPGIAAWQRGLVEGGHDRSRLHAQHHVRIFVDDNRERAVETAKAAIVRYDSTSAARGPRQPGGPIYAMDPEYDWQAMERAGRNIYGTPD